MGLFSAGLCELRVSALERGHEFQRRGGEDAEQRGEEPMHENEISERVLGAAIEVHRILGSGLLEAVYEEALCHELHLRGVGFEHQFP